MTRRLLLLGLAVAVSAPAAGAQAPARLGVDAEALAGVRARVQAGDEALRPALGRLVAEAEQATAARYESVLDKDLLPPSGDPHDYYSLAPYWWPNPETPDGLPYVRRDGEVNPESRTLDDQTLRAVLDAVPTLAWAWYFTGDDRFADKAGDLIRLWFVDAETRMNPTLQYAQSVRGESDGRMYGIIETARLSEVVGPLAVLRDSPALRADEWTRLDGWIGEFLLWLRTSEFGHGEAARTNNHGTAYDAQVAALALYLGDRDGAREVLAALPARRIDAQIEPDGRQPEELARTRSFSYSVFNLRWAFDAAQMAPAVGVDLFGYTSADGRSLRAALDFLVPVASGRDRWTRPQIEAYWNGSEQELAALLRQAAVAYGDPSYEAARERLDPASTGRYLLLYPLSTR